MSEFRSIVDAKVDSANVVKSVKSTIITAAADGTRILLAYSESLPYVGPVAQLLTAVIVICDQHKCNKDAFMQLKTRLYRFTQLFFGDGGLASIAEKRSENEILSSFTKRVEDVLNEAIIHLGSFAKVGFFSSILLGSKPQQQFNELDAELTACMNELSTALQAAQLNEQAQTYKVICDIQSKIDSHGGLQGVYNDPELLQSLADEIGADVADLKAEVKDSLDRIEATVNQVDVNVQIMLSEMGGLKRELRVFMSAQTDSGKVSSADQAALTLTSAPYIDYTKVLGQGSFGTVYEGQYGNELVAVKIISAASGLTTAQMNELNKEVLMHSKVCNLPGVVRLFGANLTSEPRCVVLELADGSLHDVLHKRSPVIDLSMTSKLSLAVQVCSTMAAISELGIIHRDIKSSNVLIFLLSQGRVSAKLADFGLAKVNTENTYATSQTPKGTPPYMAPELFTGQYSSASDVYAFTVMLNELLLEDVPFASASMHEIMMKVVNHKGRPRAYSAPVSDAVGCRLMSLISIGWNQDPQLRVTFQALADDLTHLLRACVKIARNGNTASTAATSGKAGPTTPLSPHTPEAAIGTISEWLTSVCNLLPYDSTTLAHTLVTTKCITTVAALNEVMIHNPEMLTQELKIPHAYDFQIKKVLHQIKKEMQLKDLSVAQVCLLLDSHNLHSIKPIIIENEISGTILTASFDSVDDLKEIGIKVIQAKALFKLINEWSTHGLPAAFLAELSTQRPVSADVVEERKVATTQAIVSPKDNTSASTTNFADRSSATVVANNNGYTETSGIKAMNLARGAAHAREMRVLDVLCVGDTIKLSNPLDLALKEKLWVVSSAGDPLTVAVYDITGPNTGKGVAGLEVSGAITVTKQTYTMVFEVKVTPEDYQFNMLLYGKKQVVVQWGDVTLLSTEVVFKPAQKLRPRGSFAFHDAANDKKIPAGGSVLISSHDDPRSTPERPLFPPVKVPYTGGNIELPPNLPDCIISVTPDITGYSSEYSEKFILYNNETIAGDVLKIMLSASNLSGGEWRVVLTWGADPQDLDFYCITNFEPRRIYFGAKNVGGSKSATKGNIELDIDVRNGFGPETITFTPDTTKRYRFLVHNYTGNARMSLAGSGAKLVVYKGSGPPTHFEVPTDIVLDDSGNFALFWHAFDLVNGAVVSVNRVVKEDLRHVPLPKNDLPVAINGFGVPKEAAGAVRLVELVANQDDASAKYQQGIASENGTGVAKDAVEAARLFKQAADQGHADAQAKLGDAFQRGAGVAINDLEATKYYRLAADQGHAVAQFNLAGCYKNGRGVAKSKADAKKYYKLAADQGHAQAATELSRFWF